jgi:hypothetical protein
VMTDTSTNVATTEQDLAGAVSNIVKVFRTKSVEKSLLYLVSIASATNLFGTGHLGIELRSVLVAAPAFIIGLIHNSTPVTPVK